MLIEVMVAIIVLMVGVLGSVTLVDAANKTTSTTRARESATNLARSILEATRSQPYTSLVQSTVASAVQTEPGLADSDAGTAGWQIVRRNITFTVDLTVCSVDDPADGIGNDDSTFCSTGTPTNPPDSKPADYKRAKVTLSWSDRSGPRQMTESTVISGTYRGPSVLTLSSPGGVFTDSSANPGFINLDLTASAGTDHVNWSLDGNDQGQVFGCGTFCVLQWNLGKATGSAPCDPAGGGALDGTYIVQATAYDSQGLSDNPRAVTVQLNRCPPMPPTGVEGGETKPQPGDTLKSAFPGVELQWDASPEEDVIGYHVYTSKNSTGPWTPVPPNQGPDPSIPGCDGLVKQPNCVDQDTSQNLYYQIRAVDTDPNGAQREGAPSAPLLVNPTNGKPGKPGVAVDNSFPYTLAWNGSKYGSPPPGDYTDFYYIYRDNLNGRADRYDSVDNDGSGAQIQWTDPDPNGTDHYYWVVAVDNHLAESDPAPDFPSKGHWFYCDVNGACIKK